MHQRRVCACPVNFPTGYNWYGGKRKGLGRPPSWVDQLLQAGLCTDGIESRTELSGDVSLRGRACERELQGESEEGEFQSEDQPKTQMQFQEEGCD